MSKDIEKQDGFKEEYLLSDVEAKKQIEAEEPAEDSPLRSDFGASAMDSAEKDGNLNSGEKGSKEGRSKGLREWLSKSRVKWWIAVVVAVILLTVVLVGTLLAVEDYDDGLEDNGVRLLKLWPRPNKPRNVINFVHGTRPYEGRVWPQLTEQLDSLLSRYTVTPERSRYLVECYGNPPPEGKMCAFDVGLLSLECSKAMHYGYDKGKPCIFLEFNNITDWQPEGYTTRDLENLPGLPEDLKLMYKPMQVFLDCQGDSLVDRENMGTLQYSPDRGYPHRYFPYRGQRYYMSPLVAVRFANPEVGVAISITCKLWAKNINHTDEAIPSGSISFNLLVD